MGWFLNENYKHWIPGPGTILSLDREQRCFSGNPVRWEWQAGGMLHIPFAPGTFRRPDPKLYGKAHPTFSLWVYNFRPAADKLLFEFGKAGRICSSFEYKLDFSGWRTGWVSFIRDMAGTPVDDMDMLRITAPTEINSGVLCFDRMLLCSFVDPRFHMRDRQLPQVNPAADVKFNRHWMGLYGFSQLAPVPDKPMRVPIATFEIMEKMEKRLLEYFQEEFACCAPESIEAMAGELGLTEEEEGFIGSPPTYAMALEVYPLELRERYREQLGSNSFEKYARWLWLLACRIRASDDRKTISRGEELFVKLFKFMETHGWTAGSGMGTLFRFGYAMRELAPALLLVKSMLRRRKLLKNATAMLRWFAGTGRIYAHAYMHPGANMETLAVQAPAILVSILLNDEAREKVRDLTAFSLWLGKALGYAPGLLDSFKPDGAAFHNYNHYPKYAAAGFEGCLPLLAILSNTPFMVSPQALETVGMAVMHSRYYSNPAVTPIALAGSCPAAYPRISVAAFHYLYLAAKEHLPPLAKQAAAAYLRLTAGDTTPETLFRRNALIAAGHKAEPLPEGHWNMNYAALSMHRRADWLATVHGHSRYLWRSEIYNDANLYGRYMTFGQLEILPSQDKSKCFRHDGWDWNHWPGITAPVKPIKLLCADVRNIDENGGFEEMLLSTESFAGGVNLEQRHGIFGMILNGHPKYEKNFRARKSWFFFDSLIVCLGSGIYSQDTQNPVHTTLFQSPLPDDETAGFSAPGLCGHNFNVARIDSCGNKTTWMSDSVGNGYYIPSGEFSLTFGEQTSVAQHDGSYTVGRFACAWLDHGIAPESADYEYVVCPQGEKNMPTFIADMKKRTPPYRVERKDDGAHIVRYPAADLIGYVMFRGGITDVDGPVVTVDSPCLLLTRMVGKKLKISACCPDLGLYEGDDKDQSDSDGNQVEVCVFSRLWAATPSRQIPIRLRLNRNFRLLTPEACRISDSNSGGSLLEFNCHDGLTIEAELEELE